MAKFLNVKTLLGLGLIFGDLVKDQLDKKEERQAMNDEISKRVKEEVAAALTPEESDEDSEE